MRNFRKKIVGKWKKLLRDRSFSINLALSFMFFLLSTFILKIVGLRAESLPAPALPDVIHSILPLTDVTYLSTFGFITIQILFWGYFIIGRPKDLPYALKIYELFLIFRSIFITITSLGAPALRIDDVPFFEFLFSGLYFTKDLFPSGHTGIPFIGYLIIKNKILRRFMLFCTFVMGASVLLLHVHYSIDVLGAFFVTYGSKGFYSWVRVKAIAVWNLLQDYPSFFQTRTTQSKPKVTASM